jgi:hypothetical protein
MADNCETFLLWKAESASSASQGALTLAWRAHHLHFIDAFLTFVFRNLMVITGN